MEGSELFAWSKLRWPLFSGQAVYILGCPVCKAPQLVNSYHSLFTRTKTKTLAALVFLCMESDLREEIVCLSEPDKLEETAEKPSVFMF